MLTQEAIEAMAEYVQRNAGADTAKLMLKSEPGLEFDKALAMVQIDCRRRCAYKIPELLAHPQFVFPKAISAEQCTHELVAKLHASLIGPGATVLDMTMGLGVDSYYIAQRAKAVTAIELDEQIAKAGQANYSRLAPNITVVNADSCKWLSDCNEQFDTIFIDPARRGEASRRLYSLADCHPNVLELIDLIRSHSQQLIVKASPMIDATQSCRELAPWLEHIWAVSVKGECKEMLLVLNFTHHSDDVQLHAVNFTSSGQRQLFEPALTASTAACADPQEGMWLYEPNASVMKIGACQAAAAQFSLAIVAANSHLCIGNHRAPEFPGREFVIERVIPFSSKELKELAKSYKKLNVATRNFRLSAQELKKRLKVNDGGDTYLMGTTTASGKQLLLLCRKPQQSDD